VPNAKLEQRFFSTIFAGTAQPVPSPNVLLPEDYQNAKYNLFGFAKR